MGVYHLMGLGLSPGVVTGPLSYLAHRYQRNNEDDKAFFAGSGEKDHAKVGNVQALVLFSSPEVISGEKKINRYAKNTPGRACEPSSNVKPEVMQALLEEFLPHILRDIVGDDKDKDDVDKKKKKKSKKGRSRRIEVFWCTVDRRNIEETFERVVRVVMALAHGSGAKGKEMWVNLTGGNNVTNSALQLAAGLSGEIARQYYVQAQDENSDSCIYYTDEARYWVEIPVMPLVLDPLSRKVLARLESENYALERLFTTLQQEDFNLMGDIRQLEDLRRHLTPLWKQRLIEDKPDDYYAIGRQWPVIKPYQEVLEQAKADAVSLNALVERCDWLRVSEIAI